MPSRRLPLTPRRPLGQLMVRIFLIPHSTTTFTDLTKLHDDVGTEERDLAQIQKRGGEETTAEEEEDMTSTNALTKAPIDPTMASGTINGAYISYSAQHKNIHRSHQIAFPEELGGLMTQEKHILKQMSTISTTMTMASETSNGVYISSPIQHNNILRSHQLFFTASYDEPLRHNDEEMYEVLYHCQLHMCL
jgi:hypothetical protein